MVVVWLSIVVISCSFSAAAFSATPTSKTSSNNINLNLNRRLFVGGISPALTKGELQHRLESYGSIEDISLHKNFGFVTFSNVESANNALQQCSTLDLQPSKPLPLPSSPLLPNRQKQNENGINQLQSQSQNWQSKWQAAQTTNIVFQVHHSHVDRLADFLVSSLQHQQHDGDNYGDGDDDDDIVEVQGIFSTNSRTVSLLLLQVSNNNNIDLLLQTLQGLPFDLVGVHKSYVVDRVVVVDGNNHRDNAIDNDIDIDIDLVTPLQAALAELPDGAVVRLNVFPPKLLPNILNAIEKSTSSSNYNSNNHTNNFRIAPTGQTHELSVVQLDNGAGAGAGDDDDLAGVVGGRRQGPLYLLGSTTTTTATAGEARSTQQPHPQLSVVLPNTNNNNIPTPDATICRAYSKLQEAFARCESPPKFGDKHPMCALDCGAAPGGWSKYLLDHFSSSTNTNDNDDDDDDENDCRVMSVDPGELHESVLLGESCSVEHFQMTIQEALPILRERQVVVNVWVSDMCLHEMSQQVDWLLQAHKVGVLAAQPQQNKKESSNTSSAISGEACFFVLTLKCTIGHSKKSFDSQVARQVLRLADAGARDLQTIHLFANRNGERTVMGYL